MYQRTPEQDARLSAGAYSTNGRQNYRRLHDRKALHRFAFEGIITTELARELREEITYQQTTNAEICPESAINMLQDILAYVERGYTPVN